ncbi:MAG: T9SS type A sorting domain-containing protein [Hymenobacter sp.]|nr:T9SS type A sorting domain-containing protein [Hymenobacter sp.]
MSALRLLRSGRLSPWLLLFICAGCAEMNGLLEWPPPVSFDRYSVRQPLDLTQVLGREARLLSAQDTLELRVRYDSATGLNLITDATTGDTLQRVWVTRHRQLHYFIWPINDTCYWVHAVRIRRGQVQGLTDASRQIKHLEQAVRAGRFAHLVRYQDSATGVLRLRFEPKALRKFYTTVLDSLPSYRMGPRLNRAATVRSASSPTPHPEPLLQALYPNPATGAVTLRLASRRSCEVTIFMITGELVQVSPVLTAASTLDVRQLPAGRYVVRVRESGTGRTASRQLLIKR